MSNQPDIAAEYFPINVLVSKFPKWLPIATVINENVPIEITVQMTEIP